VTTSRAGLSGGGKIFFLVFLKSGSGGCLFPLTPRPNRVLKLRISGAIPLFPPYAFLACTLATSRLSVCSGPTQNCIDAACRVRFRVFMQCCQCVVVCFRRTGNENSPSKWTVPDVQFRTSPAVMRHLPGQPFNNLHPHCGYRAFISELQ